MEVSLLPDVADHIRDSSPKEQPEDVSGIARRSSTLRYPPVSTDSENASTTASRLPHIDQNIFQKVSKEMSQILFSIEERANHEAWMKEPIPPKCAMTWTTEEPKRNNKIRLARSRVREHEVLKLLEEELEKVLLRSQQLRKRYDLIMEQVLLKRPAPVPITQPDKPSQPSPEQNISHNSGKHCDSRKRKCENDSRDKAHRISRKMLKISLIQKVETELALVRHLEKFLAGCTSQQESSSQPLRGDNPLHNDLSVSIRIDSPQTKEGEQYKIDVNSLHYVYIEQEFASNVFRNRQVSVQRLASLIRCFLTASGDEQLEIYYTCHILASRFTNYSARVSLEKLLTFGASGFPRQPILAKHMSKVRKLSLKHSPNTPVLVGQDFESKLDILTLSQSVGLFEPMDDEEPEPTDVERTECWAKLRGLLHNPLTNSMTFDVSRNVNQLAHIRMIETSFFEDWFEELLQGLHEKEQNEGPSDMNQNTTAVDMKRDPRFPVSDSFLSPCGLDSLPSTRRRYAAAMVYWAINRYGDASNSMDSGFRILLLFSAAAILESCQQVLQRNYVLALLSDILSQEIELLHQHLCLLENKILVSEVSRRVIPVAWMTGFRMNIKRLLGNDCTGEMFLLFMRLIALENEILLDDEDLILLSTLPYAEYFPFWDNEEQLRQHGICVQLRSSSEMPRESSTCMVIEYGQHSRVVMIEPAHLSPLGFSILSFILVPSQETARGFLKLIASVRTFTNCFIREFEGQGNRLITNATEEEQQGMDDSGGNDRKAPNAVFSKVFIPLGWVYFLKVSTEFLKLHGTVGSHGVLLGNTQTNPVSVGKFKDRSMFTMQLKKRRKGIVDQDHVPNERVYLDSEYKLVYAEPLKHKWHLKGVNANAKAFFFELGANVERRSISGQEPKKIWFVSLQQFITYNFSCSPRAGMLTRMKWLENALEKRQLFPLGENQRLLRNVLSEDVCSNTPWGVFSDTDCRLRCMSLQKKSLPFRVLQLTRTDKIGDLFFVDACSDMESTGKVYKCPFEVSSEGICVTGRYKSASEDDEAELRQAKAPTMDIL